MAKELIWMKTEDNKTEIEAFIRETIKLCMAYHSGVPHSEWMRVGSGLKVFRHFRKTTNCVETHPSVSHTRWLQDEDARHYSEWRKRIDFQKQMRPGEEVHQAPVSSPSSPYQTEPEPTKH